MTLRGVGGTGRRMRKATLFYHFETQTQELEDGQEGQHDPKIVTPEAQTAMCKPDQMGMPLCRKSSKSPGT